MRFTVDKLRVWLLVAAAALVCVIAAFLGYAQWRVHRLVRDLPRRLGVDIQQETNHFTYSQTVKGRTVFTIHAAKEQMFSKGKVELHDVDIVLNGARGERTDHISGGEFDYDSANGVMTAKGEVRIDLQAPEGAAGGRPGGAGAGVIHVKTSGLVFMEKMGVAATSEETEFEFNGVTGKARGAEYDSDDGLLVLQSEVRLNTLMRGRPVAVTAAHAELMRDADQAVLTRAVYVSPDADGRGQTGSAGLATVRLRKDGTIQGVDASGDVTLTTEDGGSVSAARAVAAMDALGRPTRVDMAGGVRFAEQPQAGMGSGAGSNGGPGSVGGSGSAMGGAGSAQGVAEEAHVVFGGGAGAQRGGQAAQGKQAPLGQQIQQVRLAHGVRVTQKVPEAEGSASGSLVERELTGDQVDIAFAPGADGRAEARSVKAVGGAGGAARMVSTAKTLTGGIAKGSAAGGGAAVAKASVAKVALQQLRTQRTVLSGDELDGEMAAAGSGASRGAAGFSRVRGVGRTSFTQETADGAVETSTGDALDVKMADAADPQIGLEPTRERRNAGSAESQVSKSRPGAPSSGGIPGLKGEAWGTRRDVGDGMNVERATQRGHVRITQTPAPVAGRVGAAVTALADLAEYSGAAQQLVLTGSPQARDGGATIWAKRIVLDRATGNVAAAGDVKGSLAGGAGAGFGGKGAPAAGAALGSAPAQGASTGPETHIAADHADLRHADEKAFFYGTKARRARLWQGASQVEAPTLEFDQKAQTLTAGGEGFVGGDKAATAALSGPDVVRAVFLSSSAAAAPKGPKAGAGAAGAASGCCGGNPPMPEGQRRGVDGAPGFVSDGAPGSVSDGAPGSVAPRKQEVVRVASRWLVYSDAKREGEFKGAVVVESADGTMRADSAVVTLHGAGASGAAVGASAGGMFGGSVERMVAQGDVSLDQPGRKAFGERLVCTASDGKFVLMGTAAKPPRIVDAGNGSVTGAVLMFHSADDSVVVSGDASNPKSRTETTVKR